ncbi:hypothetical protein OSTOST_21372 [Ostertagia ostertagi]
MEVDGAKTCCCITSLAPTVNARIGGSRVEGYNRQIFYTRAFYLRAKGNNFKNKKHLMEYIFRKKSENKRAKQLADQARARRDKNKEARKRREERQHAKRTELLRKISESERAR